MPPFADWSNAEDGSLKSLYTLNMGPAVRPYTNHYHPLTNVCTIHKATSKKEAALQSPSLSEAVVTHTMDSASCDKEK